MLVLADCGFFSFDLWRVYLPTGAALLWRLTATMHRTPHVLTRRLLPGRDRQ